MVWHKITLIDFDDIWQKYSKHSRIEFVCFSFCVGLLFLPTFCRSTRTPKITRILTITRHSACHVNMAPFSKEVKILIKSLYECKGYHSRQFITEFPDKGWMKNSINRLMVKLRKFRTV